MLVRDLDDEIGVMGQAGYLARHAISVPKIGIFRDVRAFKSSWFRPKSDGNSITNLGSAAKSVSISRVLEKLNDELHMRWIH